MRQKADEMEFISGQTTGGEGAGAGNGFDAEAGGDRRGDDALAGIADAWCAGIGDEGNLFTAAQAVEDFFAAPRFIELEIANEGLGDIEMLEKNSAVAGVL